MTCWIIYWDDIGIETLLNWTQTQNKYVEDMLREEHGQNPALMINYLEMRARFNNHRSPEIYAINIDEEMDQDQIMEYFKENPSAFKELIRKKAHHKIW